MIFLGREISEQRDYSDKIAEEIDEEVRQLIHNAYTKATELLTNNSKKLAQIAKYLITYETVEGDALQNLFDSSPIELEEAGELTG